jgi:hypothetical protein
MLWSAPAMKWSCTARGRHPEADLIIMGQRWDELTTKSGRRNPHERLVHR